MTFPTTRWWWIRHAPVTAHGGRIYGQSDVPANCSNLASFAGLARLLPSDATWIASHLARTHQTAAAIFEAAGRPMPALLVEPTLAEQHFGDWQGLTHDELAARRDGAWHRFWLAPARLAPPGGESFVEVIDRVGAAVERLTALHQGRDIVAVAVALGIDAERALGFVIDNCSLTRIDHIGAAVSSEASSAPASWRVATVNHPPVIL